MRVVAAQAQPSTPESSDAPSPLEARKALLEQLPIAVFRVVGDLFDVYEDKNPLVVEVHPGQTVQLLKEFPPDDYDPAEVIEDTLEVLVTKPPVHHTHIPAVVQTLREEELGTVPQQLADDLIHDLTFAKIEEVHAEEDYARVETIPQLPPITVEALPGNLAGHADLEKELPASDWEKLAQAAIERSKGRCEVTGGVGQGPESVVAMPVWRYFEGAQVLRLIGVMAVAPEVKRAHFYYKITDEEEKAKAFELIMIGNQFSHEETDIYLAQVEKDRARRAGKRWRFDLRWLEDQGVNVPRHLRPQHVNK